MLGESAVPAGEIAPRHIRVGVLREVRETGQLDDAVVGLVGQPHLAGIEFHFAQRREDVGLVAREEELRLPGVDQRIRERSQWDLEQLGMQARVELVDELAVFRGR
ncbi:hypothetical protein GCM10009676_17950 [Prauserella halophila]|uniref:Uncharacterized protein n=1 Tax=Prauserella halophila TaxID=185641 RepID=A0ABP4GQS1_9PSEU